MLQTYPKVNIINIDRMDYVSDVNNVHLLPDSLYTFYPMDINEKEKLLNILRTHLIDHVVHFAAQSHVDNSFGNSIQFTMDNVLGTHTLMECCRVYQEETDNLVKVIHISTDEVYGEVDDQHAGCNEKSLLNPTNPYAATKAAAEFIVRSYYHSFKLPVLITRGNNVIGPNQYPEKLIPKFVKQLLRNRKLTIHGKGESRRNFIHVFDVSKAVEVLLLKGKLNEIYNIGSSDEYSVMDVARILVKRIKGDDDVDKYIEYVPDRLYNDQRYCVDSSKLEDLGWKQQVDFESGVFTVINKWKALHTE